MVQGSPSSQLSVPEPAQRPPPQVSPKVQASPSSQELLFGANAQPLLGLHESSVQTFPSSQGNGVPAWQVPPEQTSPCVQASPSVQLRELAGNTHPVSGSQMSSVQTSLSSQRAESAEKTHPVAGLHQSWVQSIPSLQGRGGPAVQLPPEQMSLVVQALPSLQGSEFGGKTQPVAGSQVSSVQ
jgi:hypothetical protein